MNFSDLLSPSVKSSRKTARFATFPEGEGENVNQKVTFKPSKANQKSPLSKGRRHASAWQKGCKIPFAETHKKRPACSQSVSSFLSEFYLLFFVGSRRGVVRYVLFNLLFRFFFFRGFGFLLLSEFS